MSTHINDSPSGSFHQDDPTYMPSSSNIAVPISAVDSPFSQSSDSLHSTSASSIDDVPMSRPLQPGVYVPTVAFFKDNEDLDLATTSKHAIRLAKAGVAGLATQGSNGEAVHLTHHERNLVTKGTRRALNDAGYHSLPIIVGCGAQSTRETIELCHEALSSGGDYALVLPPCYYKPLHTPTTILEFYNDVATASPIPIIIYNYPPAASGIDLSSDTIITLAKHPNIVGCKLTCGNVGKVARIAAATSSPSLPLSITTNHQPFLTLSGSADTTLPSLTVGASGTIAGLANIAPKACVKLLSLFSSGKLSEARDLQCALARADWIAIQSGVVGTKVALEAFFGYGGVARRPLPRKLGREEREVWVRGWEEIVKVEKGL